MSRQKYKKILVALVLGFLTATIFAPLVLAIARGYVTEDQEVRSGMTVSLSSNSTADNPKVERASVEQQDKIIGVVTSVDQNPAAIVTGDGKVYVENTGEVNALISDINGEVNRGDLLVISPLRGILAKIGDKSAVVAGIALEDFKDKPAETVSYNTDSSPENTEIATLKINLDHKAASNQQVNSVDTSLGRLGRVLTGRNVGESRIVAALIIFLVVLIAEGGIIYGTVSSTIISVGRNPLSGKIIFRDMIKILLVALLVIGLGAAAIYTILWI